MQRAGSHHRVSLSSAPRSGDRSRARGSAPADVRPHACRASVRVRTPGARTRIPPDSRSRNSAERVILARSPPACRSCPVGMRSDDARPPASPGASYAADAGCARSHQPAPTPDERRRGRWSRVQVRRRRRMPYSQMRYGKTDGGQRERLLFRSLVREPMGIPECTESPPREFCPAIFDERAEQAKTADAGRLMRTARRTKMSLRCAVDIAVVRPRREMGDPPAFYDHH
jgi:hypothetical protein